MKKAPRQRGFFHNGRSGRAQAGTVELVQRRVQRDARTRAGKALDGPRRGVAAKEKPGLAREFDGLDGDSALVADHQYFGAGGDVETRLNHAVIPEGDADAGVGSQQGAFPDGDPLGSAARESAHDGGAPANVAAVANNDSLGDSAFDHGGTQRAGVEVHETLVHDDGARREVRSQAHARRIRNAHTFGGDVIGESRKTVDAGCLNSGARQAWAKAREHIWMHGASVRPDDIVQLAEDALEVDGVGSYEEVGKEVKSKVRVRGSHGRVPQVDLERDDFEGHFAAVIGASEVFQFGGSNPLVASGGECAKLRLGEPRVEDGAIARDGCQAIAPGVH